MKTWVQLARTGDILNVLPLLWADAQKGERARLMVHKDYAGLLDGVSYVEPLIWNGEPWDISGAIGQVSNNGEVICTQVNGPKDVVAELVYKDQAHAVTTSFVKEQWRVAGRLREWDLCHPLVFDRRDREREKDLVDRMLGAKRKRVVLMAADGVSSPFPYKELLYELLKHSGFTLVDLGEVKAEKFYDLLGLYEIAHALVAIDSAPLHLANAAPLLPVFALTRDTPSQWNGSAWRPNHEWYCRYKDFPARAVEMLRRLKHYHRANGCETLHLWIGNPDREQPNVNWHGLPIMPGMTWLGPQAAPHAPRLSDVIRMGLQKARGRTLAISRPETIIKAEAGPAEPAYAYRIEAGMVWPVIDFFIAPTPFWQEKILPHIPELYFNNDRFWSHCVWHLFKTNGAQDCTGLVSREPKAAKKVTSISPSAKANEEFVAKFNGMFNVGPRYPEVSKQISTMAMDVSALPAHAYNPSIAKVNGRMVMTYRYHFAGDRRTRLGMATFNGSRLQNPRDIDLTGHSLEDAKLFRFHGELWFSWVESDVGTGPQPHCVIKYGKLERNLKVSEIHQVRVGDNDGTKMEKNWCFFEDDDNMFCVHRTGREYTILQIQGPTVINEYKTAPPFWPYGQIRGGCIVPYQDKLLRFFHSRLENGTDAIESRYFIGALVMNRRPPFAVTAISKRPLLYGSESPNCGKYPYKARVVFPGGAVPFGNDWLLAVGVNDSACAVVKVTERDLNL